MYIHGYNIVGDIEGEAATEESELLRFYFENGLIKTVNRQFGWIYDKIVEFGSSEPVQTVCVRALWTVSKIMVYTEYSMVYLYNSNEYIKCYTDKFIAVKKTIFDTAQKREFVDKNWIQAGRICVSNDMYKMLYMNSDLPDDISAKDIQINYSNIYNSVMNSNNNNTCIVMKYNELYRVSISEFSNNLHTDEIDIQFIQSGNIPLSITYKHPRMDDGIELIIPNEMYCIDNCLFSNAFVLRCLENQSHPFIFDQDYGLTIIDSSVTIHLITYNKYIKVTTEGLLTRDTVNDK